MPDKEQLKGAEEARSAINEAAAQGFSGPRGTRYMLQAGAGEGKEYQAAPGVYVAKLYKPDVELCKMAAVGCDFFACTASKSVYAYPYKYTLLPIMSPCHFVQTVHDQRGVPGGVEWLLQWQLTGPKNSKLEFVFYADPPDGVALPTLRVKVGGKSFSIPPEPTRHVVPKGDVIYCMGLATDNPNSAKCQHVREILTAAANKIDSVAQCGDFDCDFELVPQFAMF